ncbi:Cobalt transport protein CbiN [Thermoanaerobacter italicus Ab9]|uniref:Cobalt transport protein CbiN n=2 Tax=Thermoanaerobacter TaxID=1754 RepID=D3T6S1_THEIA|nr:MULTISPECIES: energy-coupling factor ABC transporter substrate-binding protein [Thermoanaerobacter]ADD01684.1 Cobalt transport protein CbiN [Thermoanaerobacter italicus Ab9]MDP9749827.1 cobalt/nickel transport protein [Thermoanaerobacter pentosaceus]
MKDKKFLMKNLILGLLIILLVVFPLVSIKNAEFAGADDRATEAIAQVDKNYKPWFKPIWEPPSGEIESLLFALQAATGAGFLGYYIGVAKGRKNANR